MKITIEHYGLTMSAEFDHDDVKLDDVMDALLSILIAHGWEKETLDEWVKEKADE